MVTKPRLDEALHAWETAREGAMLEQQAWVLLLQSHQSLIASLRANGHTWAGAQAEFQALSDEHSKAVRAAWNHMDACCGDYQMLRAEFESQQRN